MAIKTVVDEQKYTEDQRVTLSAFGSLYAQMDFGKITSGIKRFKIPVQFWP